MEIYFDKYMEDNKGEIMNCEEFYGFHVQDFVATINFPLVRGGSVTKILNFRGRILCVQKVCKFLLQENSSLPCLSWTLKKRVDLQIFGGTSVCRHHHV